MASCIRGPLLGMRAGHSVQWGLLIMQSFVGCRALYLPLIRRPFNQVPRGLEAYIFVPTHYESVVPASKPGYLQNRSCNFGVYGLALPRDGGERLEAEDLVQGELESEEQGGCFEEPELESHADYLSFTDKNLLAQCVVDTYRASGAGGQHRNKTDSAVRLKHSPTGMVGQAADDRSQHVNKALALNRLRHVIAIKVRRQVNLENYEPPLELLRILPAASTIKRAKGVGQQIGPNNSSYVKGMQALLDVLAASNGSVSETAPHLGLSTGVLSKLITSDRTLWQAVNGIRVAKGLKPLR